MTDQSEGKAELDVSVGPTGVTARAKGYRLVELAYGVLVAGIVYIAVMMNMHDASAGKDQDKVAKALKDANDQAAAVQRETTKQTLDVLREIARATRESNCINSFPENQRAAKTDFCKRLSQQP